MVLNLIVFLGRQTRYPLKLRRCAACNRFYRCRIKDVIKFEQVCPWIQKKIVFLHR